MPTRLEPFLSHGSISNAEPGKVTGTLWFIDADEPVKLELEGNPHRDLAGTTLVFENPEPELDEGESVPALGPVLRGIAGDITASKKVFFQESILDNPNAYEPSLVNALCIEWYDERGERQVIDTVSFCLYAGEPEWEMDSATEKRQLESNTKRFHDYIDSIANRLRSEGDDDGPTDDDQPLNEFEWEERLKESDRITQAYMEALDKFQDLPDQEKLVAAAMGWNYATDPEAGWQVDEEPSIDIEGEDIFKSGEDDEFSSDPWLDSDPFEEHNHPLYERAYEFSIRLHRESQDIEPDDDSSNDVLTPIQTLVFAAMDLSAKLAGALNGLSGQSDSEPGFIVASLKRGLPIIDRELGAIETASTQSAAPAEWLESARTECFEIRAAMLDLIQEFRQQLP